MSLHLGNLSSHVRREELEHVFRRFGRCNVQLKDGYGFVVYDFPVNAEKALKSLRGKNICGEPITISWSNKQPRSFQRFSRGNRFYEAPHGRNLARGDDYVNRKLGPKGRDPRTGFKHPDGDGGQLSSAEMVDEVTNYHQNNINEYIGEKHNVQKDLIAEGDNVQRNFMDNNRWGERVGLPSNEIGVDDGLVFESYEPYHDEDEKKDEDGKQLVKDPSSSHVSEESLGKKGREQIGEGASKYPDVPKFRQTCYICGDFGHKMRNCPQENASRRKKLSRFNRMHDDDLNFRDKGKVGLKRLGSKSRGRLHRDGYALLTRHRNAERKESGLRKHHMLEKGGHPQVTKETHTAWRKAHLEKKRSGRENGSLERQPAKRAKGPASSPFHSDYIGSRLHSHSESSKSISRSNSHSKSRSASSGTGSPSFSSRSTSTSRRSRSQLASRHSRSTSTSRRSRSRARSRSGSSTSLSLSGSLSQPLQSFSNNIDLNKKAYSVDATCPESKDAVVEQAQFVEGDRGSENSKLEIVTVPVGNNSTMVSSKVGEEAVEDQAQQYEDKKNCGVTNVQNEANISCFPLSEKGDVTVDSSSPQNLEIKDIQNSGVLVREKISASSERLDSEVPATEYMSTPMKKPDLETSARSSTGNSSSITSEELQIIMKHYGLEYPVENEKKLSAESYFGSARLWPWEIIYYRRLRKGPISTENYARRVAQNKEFGIVDKYIRSSSGWGELGQENF
ncbi:hypothetical protein NMG60_11008619 [Bertholletia excelsa]